LGLLTLTAVRAITQHQTHAAAITATATLCALVYAAGPLLPRIRRSRPAATWWLTAVGAIWLALLVLSPDAVWVAFPLYFLQLHLLPRRTGHLAVTVTAAAAIIGFAAHQHSFTPAMAIGPALCSAVSLAVDRRYQALYRESAQR